MNPILNEEAMLDGLVVALFLESISKQQIGLPRDRLKCFQLGEICGGVNCVKTSKQ